MLSSAPTRGRYSTGRDLPQRTMSRARHDQFSHTTNPRGARLGVSFTEGHEAVVSRASLS
jgi:hypothetical protein